MTRARQAREVADHTPGHFVPAEHERGGKAHIIRAFRFELTKVQTAAVRERLVSMLANVADELAQGVAEGLGIEVPEPMPLALTKRVKPEIQTSKALSLFARPGDGGIRTRRIAILVADGVDGEAAATLHEGLLNAGAVPRFVGARLGQVKTQQGDALEVEVTLETTPRTLRRRGGARRPRRCRAAGITGHAVDS